MQKPKPKPNSKIAKIQEDMEKDRLLQEENEIRDIELLSEKLESHSKKLELLLKENSTLESYLDRQPENEPLMDESSGEFQKYAKRPNRLNLEQKYEIALEEEKFQKQSMNDGKKKSKIMIKSLNEMIKDSEIMTNELKKEILEFHKEILLSNIDMKNIKVDAQKIVDFRKAKIQDKLGMIEKFESKEKALSGADQRTRYRRARAARTTRTRTARTSSTSTSTSCKSRTRSSTRSSRRRSRAS